MRAAAALLLGALAAAAHAAPAGQIEAPFGPLPPGLKFQRPPAPWQATIGDPAPAPLPWREQAGAALARMSLPAQLDRNQALVRLQLGSGVWDVGLAGDPAFSRYYLAFTQDSRLRLAPLGDLNRLRGAGIDVEIAPRLVYNFKLSLSWVNPVRGSTLEVKPVRGTAGPAHALNTGDLVDAVKARSFVFQAGSDEYWTFYGSDIEPATGLPGGTRSLLFLRFAGLSTKAWALAERSLPQGQPSRVQLASALTMTREPTALTIAR